MKTFPPESAVQIHVYKETISTFLTRVNFEHITAELNQPTFLTWNRGSVHISQNRGKNMRSVISFPSNGASLLISCKDKFRNLHIKLLKNLNTNTKGSIQSGIVMLILQNGVAFHTTYLWQEIRLSSSTMGTIKGTSSSKVGYFLNHRAGIQNYILQWFRTFAFIFGKTHIKVQ